MIRTGNTNPSRVMQKTKKVCGRVTPDVDLELEEWALKLGINKTAIISLCIRAGLTSVIRTVKPESLLTEADWAKILKAGQDAGVEGLRDVK